VRSIVATGAVSTHSATTGLLQQLGHLHHRAHHAAVHLLAVHVAHEGAVDLDRIEGQLAQVREVAKPVPKSSSAEAASQAVQRLHEVARASAGSRWPRFSVISKHSSRPGTAEACSASATTCASPDSRIDSAERLIGHLRDAVVALRHLAQQADDLAHHPSIDLGDQVEALGRRDELPGDTSRSRFGVPQAHQRLDGAARRRPA
jgi:hypothetical protein